MPDLLAQMRQRWAKFSARRQESLFRLLMRMLSEGADATEVLGEIPLFPRVDGSAASLQELKSASLCRIVRALVVRGENTEGTLCISVGSLGFAVEAPVDNVTGADSLGDVVEWISGSPTQESFFTDQGPGTPIEAVDGVVWLNFSDRREDALSGSFCLAAMDEAGNQGEFSEALVVEHPGESSGGCATTSGGDFGLMAFFGLTLLVLRLRRV